MGMSSAYLVTSLTLSDTLLRTWILEQNKLLFVSADELYEKHQKTVGIQLPDYLEQGWRSVYAKEEERSRRGIVDSPCGKRYILTYYKFHYENIESYANSLAFETHSPVLFFSTFMGDVFICGLSDDGKVATKHTVCDPIIQEEYGFKAQPADVELFRKFFSDADNQLLTDCLREENAFTAFDHFVELLKTIHISLPES